MALTQASLYVPSTHTTAFGVRDWGTHIRLRGDLANPASIEVYIEREADLSGLSLDDAIEALRDAGAGLTETGVTLTTETDYDGERASLRVEGWMPLARSGYAHVHADALAALDTARIAATPGGRARLERERELAELTRLQEKYSRA